jgi:hypothetical protein
MIVLKFNKGMQRMNRLDTQIKKLQEVTRGEWVKFCGDWTTNAFEAPGNIYYISVTRADGRYFCYAEEHEPADIIDQPASGFNTLREAKTFAIDFGEFFESCFMAE